MIAGAWNASPACRWPWRRLLPALIASALVHYLIVDGWPPSGGIPHVPAAMRQLQAQLELPAEPLPGIQPGELPVAPVPAQQPKPAAPAVLPAVAAVERQPAPSAGAAVPDPRIYQARELDRYPVPLAPLDLRAVPGQTGIMRFWITIDPAGNVVDVDRVESDVPAALASLARQLLLATQFEPGVKEQRPVKCRILLELRYGS
jgi:hypothetical protein